MEGEHFLGGGDGALKVRVWPSSGGGWVGNYERES